jgi:hypothetical protein
MSTRWRRAFWAILALGTIIRLVVAFATRGVDFDIDSWELTRTALEHHPLHVYSLVNFPHAPHYPYPPGFFPWLIASGAVHDWTGLRFDGLVQIGPIAADAALAWVVQAYLGTRGAADRTRLAAAALIAFGPSFAFISGYHGQIDSVTILPALLGVLLWERSASPRRWVWVGVLIGLGGLVKGVPLLMLFAVLPTARSRREALGVIAVTGTVFVAPLVPFLVANFHGTLDGLRANKGLPGFGGISLLLQPGLAATWLGTKVVPLSSLSRSVFAHSPLIAGAALSVSVIVVWLRRLQPLPAAVVLWLALYAFNLNYSLQYIVWGLPFFLCAGYVRRVALVEAWLLIPTTLLYVRFRRDLPWEYVYTPFMIVLWAALLGWLVAAFRRPAPATASGSAAVRPDTA